MLSQGVRRTIAKNASRHKAKQISFIEYSHSLILAYDVTRNMLSLFNIVPKPHSHRQRKEND